VELLIALRTALPPPPTCVCMAQAKIYPYLPAHFVKECAAHFFTLGDTSWGRPAQNNFGGEGKPKIFQIPWSSLTYIHSHPGPLFWLYRSKQWKSQSVQIKHTYVRTDVLLLFRKSICTYGCAAAVQIKQTHVRMCCCCSNKAYVRMDVLLLFR